MRELAMFRAVEQARGDMAEGIAATVAVRTAARRFNVPADSVAIHAVTAYRECCRAASAIDPDAPTMRPGVDGRTGPRK